MGMREDVLLPTMRQQGYRQITPATWERIEPAGMSARIEFSGNDGEVVTIHTKLPGATEWERVTRGRLDITRYRMGIDVLTIFLSPIHD